MTVHAAKGLEFPVVCLADLGRQPNVQTPDLLVQGERVGVRLVRLDGEGSRPALDYESLARERRRREAEEEDRILYVAMTRARERLLLSGAIDFARWPAPREGATPISWLAPALSAELPALAQAAARGRPRSGDPWRRRQRPLLAEHPRDRRQRAAPPAAHGGRSACCGPGPGAPSA